MAQISEEIIDGVTVLHLGGSLTQDCVPEIEKRFGELARVKKARAVIEVGEVDAITTPAIAIFLGTVRAIEAGGGKLVFANAQGIIGDIFARCRLDAIFTLAGSVPAAVKAVRAN
ncbi:MAG TPA: STAS domain-containing protein [Tepidisphaeraceae bacterium]|jgi:anti-anti-sigma factor|nr:STAS domain-containing protein [Tepidisphaeraceae bacterium]